MEVGCANTTLQKTGGSQSPEQPSRRDFPSSEYTNMFQYANVYGHLSLLFWAVSTKSSRLLILLTLLSQIGGINQVTSDRFFVCPGWYFVSSEEGKKKKEDPVG